MFHMLGMLLYQAITVVASDGDGGIAARIRKGSVFSLRMYHDVSVFY